MNRRKPTTSRQLAREKLVFRYSSALERGDFEVISAVLREAENDPVLERMLHEINDVYRAELAPPPALPSFSANHNHRAKGEDATMSVTYPSIRRVALPAASRGRWTSMATLAAAIIAIIVFAAILIARRPPTHEQQGNPVIGLQNELATPSASPTWTPTPAAQQPNLTATPTAFDFVTQPTYPGSIQLNPTVVQDAGMIFPTQPLNLSVACRGTVKSGEAVDGVNVFSDSTSNGVYMGRIPLGAEVDILSIRATGEGGWYYVRADSTEGWMSAAYVTVMTACVDANGQVMNGFPICAYLTGIHATETSLVAEATGTAVMLQPTIVPLCQDIPNIGITPTAGIPYGAWNSTMLREVYGGLPANTPVRVWAAYFDGTQWQYAVQTLDGLTQLYVPESSLIIYAPPPTPTAVFDLALRSGGYDLITTEQVGDIPANTRVRINSAQFDGTQWLYDVIAKDGQTRGLAYEYQLTYVPGVTLGAATPTAMFGSAIGTGFYSAVTTQPIGDIPAGTPVHISSAWYNGTEWIYQIQDENGRFSDNARESQLSLAPGYAPGMPTPTAPYFERGNLLTLAQVGDIPAGTLVQTTSGYYNGHEWVYTIVTLSDNVYGEARDSQLRYATADDYGPGPTPSPTYTPTPSAIP